MCHPASSSLQRDAAVRLHSARGESFLFLEVAHALPFLICKAHSRSRCDPQIGVQSVYEDVARDTNRGHTVQATCESFQLAKDAGFKVVSHMMVCPSLPLSASPCTS